MVGVAPGVRLWSVRVLDDDNRARGSSLLCGIEHGTLNANIYEVANLSITGPDVDADDQSCGSLGQPGPAALYHRAICASVDAGVVYVVAAGNNCDDSADWYPAAFDEVITVSAMVDTDGLPGGKGPAVNTSILNCRREARPNRDDSFSSFSNHGADIDLAAPGVDVLSTLPNGGYGRRWGTSMATPHVAGAAALFLSANPGATPNDVRNALLSEREAVALSGDPDGLNEGVLNVNDRLPWSDATPPGDLVLTITESETDEHVVGTTLFYNPAPGNEGQYTVLVTGSDAESGIASVAFPSVLGTQPSTDKTAPFQRGYRWGENDTATVTKRVTVTNGDGLPAAVTFSVDVDRGDPVVNVGNITWVSSGDIVEVSMHTIPAARDCAK